jgi:hypothetical protein
MNDDSALELTAKELVTIRSDLSLASQVIYQCRVLALLRERPDEAAQLLRDPVRLARAYRMRWD